MWYSPTIIVGWTDSGHAEQVAWIAGCGESCAGPPSIRVPGFFNLIPNLATRGHESVEDWRALIHRSIADVGRLFRGARRPVVRTRSSCVRCSERRTGRPVLPFQIAIWMIPAAWLGGHFRGQPDCRRPSATGILASAIAGITTVLLAWEGARLDGAPGRGVRAGRGRSGRCSGVWHRGVPRHRRISSGHRGARARPAWGRSLIGFFATSLIGRAGRDCRSVRVLYGRGGRPVGSRPFASRVARAIVLR